MAKLINSKETKTKPKRTLEDAVVSGGVAGFVSRSATAPLDRLRVLLQMNFTTNKLGVLQGIRQIYAKSGLRGYYVGNGINVCKATPEAGIKFSSFDFYKSLVGDTSTVDKLVCGGLAGATSQAAIYPLDVMKTRIQVQGGTLVSTFKTILAKEGIKALYRGLLPSLLGIIPYAGVDLAMYETLKELSGASNPWQHLVCGMTSGSAAAAVSYPLFLVRTRLQAQPLDTPQYNGMLDVFKKTVKNEGFRGLYKGLIPCLIRVAPACSITYAVYEQIKKLTK